MRLMVLLAIVTLALGGLEVAHLMHPALPDPETASPDDLLYWLATVDLAEVNARERGILADRLERAYRGQFNPDDLREWVSPKYYDQVIKNLPILFRTWLFDRSNAYSQADSAEKRLLVDDSLAAVEAWGNVKVWTDDANSGESTQTAFLKRLEIWRSEAEADQRTRLDTFLCDLQAARLAKMLFGKRAEKVR